jgi:hypothetical protein
MKAVIMIKTCFSLPFVFYISLLLTYTRHPIDENIQDNRVLSAIVLYYTGRFIMFSVITNIYNKKTKGLTLMELFTATGKLKKFFFDN